LDFEVGCTAIADSTVHTPRKPSVLWGTLEDRPADAVQAWWATFPFMEFFSILVFGAEFKRIKSLYNKNQLLMLFAAAQYQRRFLGLERTPIFGATCAQGVIEFFASWWYTHEVNGALNHSIVGTNG
jgi:hypothetical protein